MTFKEVKSVITGYKEYFYTMLGCEINLEYNKRLKEFVIKRKFKDQNMLIKVISFEVGELKYGVVIRLQGYSKIAPFFKERYTGVVEELNWCGEGVVVVKSLEELKSLFQILEDLNFFGGKRTL